MRIGEGNPRKFIEFENENEGTFFENEILENPRLVQIFTNLSGSVTDSNLKVQKLKFQEQWKRIIWCHNTLCTHTNALGILESRN